MDSNNKNFQQTLLFLILSLCHLSGVADPQADRIERLIFDIPPGSGVVYLDIAADQKEERFVTGPVDRSDGWKREAIKRTYPLSVYASPKHYLDHALNQRLRDCPEANREIVIGPQEVTPQLSATGIAVCRMKTTAEDGLVAGAIHGLRAIAGESALFVVERILQSPETAKTEAISYHQARDYMLKELEVAAVCMLPRRPSKNLHLSDHCSLKQKAFQELYEERLALMDNLFDSSQSGVDSRSRRAEKFTSFQGRMLELPESAVRPQVWTASPPSVNQVNQEKSKRNNQ